MQEAAIICPCPCKLTFDLLTLKVVSESHVTWAASVPILVFLSLSVLDLGPMYATDRRQTDVRRGIKTDWNVLPETVAKASAKSVFKRLLTEFYEV